MDSLGHCGLLRTLVVDDYADGLTVATILLQHLGCEVQTVPDPRECARIAAEFQPQLVLLDLAIPGMDGFVVAQELRRLGLPFLLVAHTGFGDEATRRRCATEGFDSFLLKPASAADLKAVISRARASH